MICENIVIKTVRIGGEAHLTFFIAANWEDLLDTSEANQHAVLMKNVFLGLPCVVELQVCDHGPEPPNIILIEERRNLIYHNGH